ncbi:MAG: LysM peptidoglycan-binding domain-containing protein [Chlamydiae bacterium]|jgi:LysM repeat protein|nr:LysM peptidoglycan-binding domain-containing protein [Chlamydiota bacterium]
MSRKDTIIIAVLINVGLLIVLFATSISSQSEQTIAKATPTQAPDQAEVAYSSPALSVRPSAVADEVDQVLTQYSLPAQVAEAPVVVASIEPTISSVKVEQEVPAHQESISSPIETASAERHESAFVEVTVKKGDVLEKIARIHHCSIEEIMKANQLSSSRLRIGQVLKVPQKGARVKETHVAKSTASAPATKSSESSSTGKYYIVKPGDNPWTIAVKNHMKVEELLKLNNLDEKAARRLKPGDQLRIQ